jgi:hypothetical protein
LKRLQALNGNSSLRMDSTNRQWSWCVDYIKPITPKLRALFKLRFGERDKESIEEFENILRITDGLTTGLNVDQDLERYRKRIERALEYNNYEKERKLIKDLKALPEIPEKGENLLMFFNGLIRRIKSAQSNLDGNYQKDDSWIIDKQTEKLSRLLQLSGYKVLDLLNAVDFQLEDDRAQRKIDELRKIIKDEGYSSNEDSN